MPLPSQEYKWLPAYCKEGLLKYWNVTLQWTDIPSGGGGEEKKNPSQLNKLWMDGSFYLSTDLSFKKAKKIPLGKSQIH